MSFHIIYDHSNLSMSHLHATGIRNTRELEEVIEGLSSCTSKQLFNNSPVYFFVGLTKACKGLKIALTVDASEKYITLDAMIPQPKELLRHLCKKEPFKNEKSSSKFCNLIPMKNQEKKLPGPGEPGFVNPFLSKDRDALWEKLEKEAVPISKEEVMKRAEALSKGKRA